MESGGSSEFENLVKVSIAVTACLIYTYYLVAHIPKDKTLTRLLSMLPVLYIFSLIPLYFQTFHLRTLTFFSFLWLGNFKLILFAFDKGPLAHPISFASFLTSALFPINVQISTTTPDEYSLSKMLKSSLLLLIKLIVYTLMVYNYQFDYKKRLHPHLVLILYCLFLYVAVSIVLAITVLPVKLFLGRQYEFSPQFNEPYYSTSLQDFWGRRWNLMVTNILRPTVYHPVHYTLKPRIGHRPATFVATIAVFTVSGLMHELMWFYFTSLRPTWEATCFFVLHGLCTAFEVTVKRAVGGRVKVGAIVSASLTMGFIGLTANLLFFPYLLRNSVDEWALSEFAPLGRLVTQIVDKM